MTENTKRMLKHYRSEVNRYPEQIRELVRAMEARLLGGWKAADLHSAIEVAEAVIAHPELREFE